LSKTSKVERMKRQTKRFLGDQYREFVPPRAKNVVTRLRKREPWARATYESRKIKGKALAKELISKQLGKLPLPKKPKLRRKK